MRFLVLVGQVARRAPRLTAGLWYACFGFIGAGSLFLASAVVRGRAVMLLYVCLPALAGGIAGSISGATALCERRRGGTVRAMFQGVLVTFEAYLLFAPIFSVMYVLTSGNSVNLPGLTIGVLTVGFLATAVLFLPLGAFAGLMLTVLTGRSEKTRG